MSSNHIDRNFRNEFKEKNKLKHGSHSHPIPFIPKKNQSSKDLSHKVTLYFGNIVDEEITDEVDAVVNPSNERLWAVGTGVSGAIYTKAGYDKLQNDCHNITSKTDDNSIANGQTAVTDAYDLNVNHIYHTVAPCDQNKDDLKSCYYTSLEACVISGDRSIAFPCIGTGDGNFSKHSASSTALQSVKQWLHHMANVKYMDFMQQFEPKKWQQNIMKSNDEQIYMNTQETVADRIEHIVFCCFDEENLAIYNTNIRQIYPSDAKHSYLWLDRIKYMEFEYQLSLMQQRIHSLEMENNQLKTGQTQADDIKVDEASTKDTETNAIEQIFNNLIEEQKRFKKEYNQEKISEKIQSFSHQRINLIKDIFKYSECLNTIKEIVDEFSSEVEERKKDINTLSIPDVSEYKQWNVDDILIWILSLDNHKFESYIEQLKEGFIASEITCGEILPELTRSDLSVPPFSIHSFPVKKELIKHFHSLKIETEGK